MSQNEFVNHISESKNAQLSHAQQYWAFANSYLDAANQLLDNPTDNIFIPTLYLLGHSLELHFKSYLIYRGIPEKILPKQFGHNLVSCLRECKKQGLYKYVTFSQTQVRQIARMNHYYQEKNLEYFFATTKRFGSIEDFQDIVNHISKVIIDLLIKEVFRTLPESAL